MKDQEPNFLFLHRFRVSGFDGQTCRMCHSPWHEASGSSDGFCGACCKSLVKGLKEMTSGRRWAGQEFYKFATVPPKGDLL